MYESLLENINVLIFIIVTVLVLTIALFEGMANTRLSQEKRAERKPSNHD